MKLTRRFTLLVATTALVLGSVAPPALAARPVKPPPSADLSLSISSWGGHDTSVPLEGETSYWLYIFNRGPSKASAGLDVSVSGGSVKSWTWEQGTCTSPSSLTVQCDLGVVLAGAGTKVTVVVKPNLESLATGVTISGNVYGDQPDPITTNNRDSMTNDVFVMQAPSTPDSPIDCCWGE